jgi:hypothetical protein
MHLLPSSGRFWIPIRDSFLRVIDKWVPLQKLQNKHVNLSIKKSKDPREIYQHYKIIPNN